MLYLLDANVLIDANRDYYPLGRVPEFWDWLIDRAASRQVKARRTVVTTEVSRPKKQRANRHIPNVCDALGVLHCNTYDLIRELDFTTQGRP